MIYAIPGSVGGGSVYQAGESGLSEDSETGIRTHIKYFVYFFLCTKSMHIIFKAVELLKLSVRRSSLFNKHTLENPMP